MRNISVCFASITLISWMDPWILTEGDIFYYVQPLSRPDHYTVFDNKRMSKTVKIAAVQAAPVAFDVAESLSRVAHFTAEAAEAGADLVVFP